MSTAILIRPRQLETTLLHPIRHLKKKPISIFILFLLIAGAFLLFSYISIDITAHKASIKARIEENINATIEFDKAMVRLLPYPTITVTELAIFSEGDAIIRSGSLKISVSPIALIKRQLNIKRLIVKDGVALIKRYKDGSINILKLRKEKAETETGTAGFRPKEFKFIGGHLLFIDEKVENGGLEISEVRAYLHSTGRGYTFSLGGTLGKKSTFILSGLTSPEQAGPRISGTMDLTNIEVATVRPYLHKSVADITTEGTLGASLDFSFAGTEAQLNSGTIKGSLSSKRIVLAPPYPVKEKLHSPSSSANLEVSWSTESFLFALSDISVNVADPETHLRQIEIGGKVKLSATKTRSSGMIEADLHTSEVETKYLKSLIDLKGTPVGIRRTLTELEDVEGKVAIRRLIVLSSLSPRAQTGRRDKKIALKLELLDTGITHKALNHKVSGLSGYITYKDGELELLNIKGRYGEEAIKSLSGSVSLGPVPVVKLSLTADLDSAAILKELRGSGKIPKKKHIKAQGLVGIELKLDGELTGLSEGRSKNKKQKNTKGLIIDSTLDLTRTSLEFENSMEKEMNFPLIIETKTHIKAGTITSLARVKAGSSLAKVRLDTDNKTGSIDLNIEMKSFKIKDSAGLSPFVLSGFPAKGAISGHLTMTKPARGRRPAFDANIKVKNAAFNTPVLANRLRDFNLTLRLGGNKGRLILSDAKVLDSQLSARIEVLDISQGLLDMNFVSKSFNTKDIFPPTYKPKVIKRQPFKGKGQFTVAKGRLTNISFTNMHSEIELDYKDILFKPVTFTSHEGQVSGTILIKRDRRDPILFTTEFDISMVELETLFSELGAKKKILSGRGMGQCLLVMRRGIKPGSRGVDGFFSASSQKGRMWKLVVFNKLFSIVNIISVNSLFDKGLIYDSVTGDFTIKDGVISTENLLLSSNSMRMSGIGAIDITEKTIDATVALHPLVTIDKIISNIPFAGWIITGREKSTVTIYSEIKGPLKDPEVRAVPLKSIGRKIGGIFKRLLFIPDKKKPAKPFKDTKNIDKKPGVSNEKQDGLE